MLIIQFLGSNLNANFVSITLHMLSNSKIRFGLLLTFIAQKINKFHTSFLRAQTSRKTLQESFILQSLLILLKSSLLEEDMKATFELMTLVCQDFTQISFTRMTHSFLLIVVRNSEPSLSITGIQSQIRICLKQYKLVELLSLFTLRIHLLGITQKDMIQKLIWNC